METLISNVVLNISTNLKINLTRFVGLYGGNYSKILPAARRIVNIFGLRYSFLIHSTGTIILSNFHFLFNQSKLFSWIFSLLKSMIKNNVATINDDTNKLKIKLLVENVCFASNIDICKRFEQINKLQLTNISIHEAFRSQKQLNYGLLDRFLANLREIENVISVKSLKRDRFPATIIKIKMKRNWLELINYKSFASRKRKIALTKTNKLENLYEIQNCTIEFFLNGKLTVTGSQSKEDFSNILHIFYVLFNTFFSNC
jgi:hypothetical protein